MSENRTKVYLMNVPLENDYKHTFYFNTFTEQQSYFLNKRTNEGTFTEFSYQRKEGVIRVPLPYEKSLKYNYVMYWNEDKWFYAFITNYDYKGDDLTNLTIETDVIQTYMFDYTIQPSFVEREHCDNDTIGLHTYPENLECGEFVCNNVKQNHALTNRGIIVGLTRNPNVKPDTTGIIGNKGYPIIAGSYYNGVYSGIKYYYLPAPEKVKTLIEELSEAGVSESIQCIFMAPAGFIPTKTEGEYSEVESSFKAYEHEWVHAVLGGESDTLPEKPNNINGYIPKNKKLLTFPYCYLLASNNCGASNIYKYEYFNGDVDFKILSAITPGMSIRMLPKNYKGVDLNNDEGLTCGKFPICAWSTDVYTNWLTQNSVNIGLDIVSGVGQIVVGTAIAVGSAGLGGVVGGSTIVGGVSTISGVLAQMHQMSFQSPTAQGNVNSGDVSFSSGNLTFTLYQMSIKQEYAKIIDEYFDMFGYKTNRIKVPNKNHRSNWWFTKTIDVNIKGAIPLTDLNKIKECYNQGITFWNDKTNFKDYSQSNTIK